MSVKNTTVGMRYGTPGKDAYPRATDERRCDAPGCTTILSTYNSSTTCYLHSEPTTRHPLAAS
jgi:hypothetical protein